MRKLFLLFSFGFLFSWHQQEKIKPHFEYIDITFFGGKYSTVSIRVDSNKNIRLAKIEYDDKKNNDCRRGTIDSVTFSRINKSVADLLLKKVDSVYEVNCWDCGAFQIIIKYADKKIKSKIFGFAEASNPLKSLINILGDESLTENLMLTDSCFGFQTSVFEVPPPFSPPIIKSDN